MPYWFYSIPLTAFVIGFWIAVGLVIGLFILGIWEYRQGTRERAELARKTAQYRETEDGGRP